MKRFRVITTTVLILLGLTACSGQSNGPGGETTCAHYLALQLPLREQLMQGKRSKKQEDIVKRMLAAHGVDTSQANQAIADTQIVQFCGIGGTVDRMNSDRPIEDAIDWK